jgi:hypothetical protein
MTIDFFRDKRHYDNSYYVDYPRIIRDDQLSWIDWNDEPEFYQKQKRDFDFYSHKINVLFLDALDILLKKFEENNNLSYVKLIELFRILMELLNYTPVEQLPSNTQIINLLITNMHLIHTCGLKINMLVKLLKLLEYELQTIPIKSLRYLVQQKLIILVKSELFKIQYIMNSLYIIEKKKTYFKRYSLPNLLPTSNFLSHKVHDKTIKYTSQSKSYYKRIKNRSLLGTRRV